MNDHDNDNVGPFLSLLGKSVEIMVYYLNAVSTSFPRKLADSVLQPCFRVLSRLDRADGKRRWLRIDQALHLHSYPSAHRFAFAA